MTHATGYREPGPCLAGRGAGRRGRCRRRGAAMVEFCLVVPLLASVLVLILFAGWAFTRLQRVGMSARYAMDARIQRGAESVAPLDEEFFDPDQTDVYGPDVRGRSRLLEAFARRAGAESPWSQDLLTAVDASRVDGLTGQVTGDFHTRIETYRRLGNVYTRGAARTDHGWRLRRFRLHRSVEDTFLPELMEMLDRMPPPADHLAESFDRAWRSGW